MFFVITHSPYFIDIKTIDDFKNIIVCHLDSLPTYVTEIDAQDEYKLKKGQRVIVPMNSVVREILGRYGNNMPTVQSNQATNTIKKICRMAGITPPVAIRDTSGDVTQDKIFEKADLITTHEGLDIFDEPLSSFQFKIF